MGNDKPKTLTERFTALWHAGAEPPNVGVFLRQHSDSSLAAVIEVLLADLKIRHAAGCPCPVEDYLREFPAVAADPERKLDLVYADYRAAVRSGTAPDPSALAARFPDLAEALHRHLQVDALLDCTAAPSKMPGTGSFAGSGLLSAPGPMATVSPPPGYEFVRELGQGGFGTVWLARHLALQKSVAVKHLRPERVSAGGADALLHEARTMASFTAMLRGCRTSGLADRLRTLCGPRTAGPQLNLTVSTAAEKDLVFRTVFRGSAAGDCPSLRCDEVVRIEAEANTNGYLTVLNLSSSGEVDVLFPNPRTPDNRIRAGRPQRLTVKLTPPAGTDHAVLVWTPGPCPLSAREWGERIESGQLVLAPPRERGLEFVDMDAPDKPAADFVAAAVGIEHGG